MKTIGQRIKKIRKEHKDKQSDLAYLLNVSQQVISNIECDKTTPDIEQLKRIADRYQISLDQLVGRVFQDKPPNEVERQIINCIMQLDDEGKELSLGLLNQVVQHRGSNEDDQ